MSGAQCNHTDGQRLGGQAGPAAGPLADRVQVTAHAGSGFWARLLGLRYTLEGGRLGSCVPSRSTHCRGCRRARGWDPAADRRRRLRLWASGERTCLWGETGSRHYAPEAAKYGPG